MNSKQKVFIILTPGFAASESDTSCLPMQQEFVRAISKLYPEIRIIVLSFHYPFIQKTYCWFSASVTSFNGKNNEGLQGVLLRKRVEHKLEQIHKEKNIVGLLSFWLGECAFVGKRFAQRKGLVHYCWLMGQDAKSQNKYPHKLSIKANEVIALSDFLQQEFERNYSLRPAKVVYPGIEKKNISKVLRNIDLLAVGSLISLKRFEIFLEVIAIIKKQLPGIKATLIGDGPEFKKLKNLASAFGIEETIFFAGSINHNEVLDTMQRTKILLHPSSFEGFSGVCQEALSSGAHVISFCRAMDKEIRHWHIVQTKDQMIQKAITILKDKFVSFDSIGFKPMSATAQEIMNCYL